MKGRKPTILRPTIPLKLVSEEEAPELPTADQTAIRIVPPPDFMSEAARRVWEELIPHVVAKGHWDPRYCYQFAGYCESVSNFIAATADLAMMGKYFETKTRNGMQEKKRAAWGQQQEALGHMQRLSSAFGLSPVDAARIDGGGQGDLFDDVLNQINGTD